MINLNWHTKLMRKNHFAVFLLYAIVFNCGLKAEWCGSCKRIKASGNEERTRVSNIA